MTPNDEDDVLNGCSSVVSNKEESKFVNKMLVCADSHGKNLSWHLNKNKGKAEKNFESISFVHPGGRTNQILQWKNIEEELTNKDDILVMICGTNDVARNEAHGVLTGIEATLDQLQEDRQVVLVDLPNRYDLLDWSCVNQETRRTNLALKSLCKKYRNVSLVEASKAERHLHTSHGMHLNWRGKNWLAEKICEAVKTSCRESEPRPHSPVPEQEQLDLTEVSTPSGNGLPIAPIHQPTNIISTVS